MYKVMHIRGRFVYTVSHLVCRVMCKMVYIRGQVYVKNHVHYEFMVRFLYITMHIVTRFMCTIICTVVRCVYQSASLGPADEHSNERSVSPHVAPVPSLRGGGCVGRQHGIRTPPLLP